MDEVKEILLVADTSTATNHSTVSVFDYETSNVLQIHKGGGVAEQQTLDTIGNDYIITAEKGKAVLHVWSVNSQEELKGYRFVMPSHASALRVCPKGIYLAAGFGAKLYVWHLASGLLLSVQQKHFQPISCIRFSSDGNYVVVAGQDGMLVVWTLARLVALQDDFSPQSGSVEPLHSTHMGIIKDMHVGKFGGDGVVATVSADRICHLYTLSTGVKLRNIIFNEDVTSVTMDNVGWHLYVGTNVGTIYVIDLTNPSRSTDFHVSDDESAQRLVNHTMSVTALSVSCSGQFLASGSADCSVIIWDTNTKNSLTKIPCSGSISCIKFSLSSSQMYSQDFKPTICIQSLQRNLDMDNKRFCISVYQNETVSCSDGIDRNDTIYDLSDRESKAELIKLQIKNQQLFNTSCLLLQKYHKFSK